MALIRSELSDAALISVPEHAHLGYKLRASSKRLADGVHNRLRKLRHTSRRQMIDRYKLTVIMFEIKTNLFISIELKIIIYLHTYLHHSTSIRDCLQEGVLGFW